MVNLKSTLFGILAVVLLSFPAIADEKNKAVLKIKPGDQYRLSIRGVPAGEKPRFDGLYRVDDKGGINIPLVGRVQIGGMTKAEAEKAMEDALMKRGVYKLPDIEIGQLEEAPHP